MPRSLSLIFRLLSGCFAFLGLSLRTGMLGETQPRAQIDRSHPASEDGYMVEVLHDSPRRSARIFHKMRVQAAGRAHNGRKFKEVCETVVVNAHGGLLMLKHEIDNGEMLVLTHPETQEEQECRVVYLGEPSDRGQRVGVEFLTPAPRFWGLEFGDAPASSLN